MKVQIIIEDYVVPQILTSAIEAYEIFHKKTQHSKITSQLETYGLLWGYVLPERGDQPVRIVATIATVETSALQHQDWVQPSYESLKMKRDFFNRYWPHIELVGTFHSHPYINLATVNSLKGWRASDYIDDKGQPKGDVYAWPHAHENLFSDMPHLAHVIITVAALEKKGWANPSRLANSESDTGYVLSADWRKIWIKGYCTEQIEDKVEEDEDVSYTYVLNENIKLEIPSLEKKFE